MVVFAYAVAMDVVQPSDFTNAGGYQRRPNFPDRKQKLAVMGIAALLCLQIIAEDLVTLSQVKLPANDNGVSPTRAITTVGRLEATRFVVRFG